MRILFFSHYYSPEGNAPATRVSALAERWAAAGHEVTVVTCAPNVPNGVVYEGYRNRKTVEMLRGVKVVRVKTYIAANKGAVKRMLNFVSYFFSALWTALRLPKPDVAIATSPQIFCGYAGVWYKRLRRVPLVMEVRDIWPESMGAVGANIPRLAYWVLERIERAMYRACVHLVTVGEGYRMRLVEKGVPEDKVSIVMNGTDLFVYKPGPKNEELLEKYGLTGKFVVSYIGTVGMACGLEVVLEAAEIFINAEKQSGEEAEKILNGGTGFNAERQRGGEAEKKRISATLPLCHSALKNELCALKNELCHSALRNGMKSEVVFAIVGDGAHRANLEEEAKKRGLTNVVFTGRQPKESMPDWINVSDASLVHLKKAELFTTVMPSKIFESAGCKKPIIMGVDGYAKKLVMDAQAGLDMKPEDAESLVACVQRLVDDPDLCRQLGENAYNNIAKVHNRDQQAEDYLAILKAVQVRQQEKS